MPKKHDCPAAWSSRCRSSPPKLSSYWIHLVTPLPAAIGRPLAEGLRTPVICQENRLRALIPQELLTCRETIRLALQRQQQQRVDTCWMDAGAMLPPEWLTCGDAAVCRGHHPELRLSGGHRRLSGGGLARHRQDRRKNRLLLRHRLMEVAGVGGPVSGRRGLQGRAAASRGPGPRRCPGLLAGSGREPRRRLLLLAEMKLPGEAVLEFSLD